MTSDPESRGDDAGDGAEEPAAEHRADRADRDFGKAAADDQERADAHERRGGSVDELDDAGGSPRAGRKADPAGSG